MSYSENVLGMINNEKLVFEKKYLEALKMAKDYEKNGKIQLTKF